MAASTPWRRTGCSVISVISSASKQACIMVFLARSARYSGSERPAWRMNHTGTRLGLRPTAAARYGDSGRSRRVLIGIHAAMQSTLRRACAATCPDRLASNAMTSAEPAQFREAVAAMNATTVRPEIELGPIRPPQRLAPFSYALGAEVRHPETAVVPERSEGDAFGRLILLHDPEGAEAWDGTMRLVAYIQADLDSSEAVDPLLPEVAWSWLVEALAAHETRHRARRHRHRDHVGALRRHLRSAAGPPARTARVVDGDHAGAGAARAGVLRGARARRRPAAGRGHRPGLPHARVT